MKSLLLILQLTALMACGRAPSNLLRQGQLPLNDFPLFISDGAAGTIYKLDKDGNRETLLSGLSDPRGIATDRFNHLYVVEYGLGRLLEVDPDTGDYTVVRDGLDAPNLVAVDSFNEPFVTQDGAQNIIRATDAKVQKEFNSIPSALVFGVADTMIVGLFSEGQVFWGEGDTAMVENPVNAAIDGSGRVYVSEASVPVGRVLRFHQLASGGDSKVVADNLDGPLGTAVDSVGNIYVIEQGAGRIVLITHEGDTYIWLDGFVDPQYLAFTKY